ncbi:hypothetical protein FVF58_36705 [Paraburkholderia panacisoli]|uniref:Uncharacterized protein n=1 Tax=Paraburkholderia panacisoli TaxID=2603818 RepID=A0A5B0GLW4_9BURK|nr:hypothetical protein FVF58_36705 [Paraburkholderia panacisoli]
MRTSQRPKHRVARHVLAELRGAPAREPATRYLVTAIASSR